eukprot:1632622-Prorocentrum_lima.AAC.1
MASTCMMLAGCMISRALYIVPTEQDLSKKSGISLKAFVAATKWEFDEGHCESRHPVWNDDVWRNLRRLYH